MPETILITGISGYIGAHIAHAFLDAGYSVRGALRSLSDTSAIKARSPGHQHKLTFTAVPDISAPHAFVDAVKDVVAIIHSASPFAFNAADNERDLLLPAIGGTMNVLKAVEAHSPTVRRVVITSSIAAIVDLEAGARPGYRYTAEDWNPISYEAAKETSSGSVAYCASKAFAERALWEWTKEHRPAFSIVCVNPPWVETETYIADGSKAKEVLGLEYRSLGRTLVGTVNWLVENGHA